MRIFSSPLVLLLLICLTIYVSPWHSSNHPSSTPCTISGVKIQNSVITLTGTNFPLNPCVEVDCNKYSTTVFSHNTTSIQFTQTPQLSIDTNYGAMVFDCGLNSKPCFDDHGDNSGKFCVIDFTSEELTAAYTDIISSAINSAFGLLPISSTIISTLNSYGLSNLITNTVNTAVNNAVPLIPAPIVNAPACPAIPAPVVNIPAPIVNTPACPAIPAPVVNVAAPIINTPACPAIPAPIVNIPAPIISIPECPVPIVNMPDLTDLTSFLSDHEVQCPLSDPACHVNEGNWRANFYFSVMGDTDYAVADDQTLANAINMINQEQNAFVVHVGDQQGDPKGFKAGNNPQGIIAINETQFAVKRNVLWGIKHPFIITPGDNDWSDTIQSTGGLAYPWPLPGPPNADPIGTLNAFRNVYYRQGTNVPFPFTVTAQPDVHSQYSDYVENRLWIYNGIVFVTVSTISGENGLTPAPSSFSSARTAIFNEALIRIQANDAWLNYAFDTAISSRAMGIVIMTQVVAPNLVVTPAQVGLYDFRNPVPFNPSAGVGGSFSMLGIIRNRSLAANLKTLIFYGDGHLFAITKPFPEAGTYPDTTTTITDQDYTDSITVVQVPGSSSTTKTGKQARVRVKVNFDKPSLYEFSSSTTGL
jgi:hypothetical protein